MSADRAGADVVTIDADQAESIGRALCAAAVLMRAARIAEGNTDANRARLDSGTIH